MPNPASAAPSSGFCTMTRPLPAVEPGEGDERAPGADNAIAAPAPCQRAQPEPLGADLLAVTLHPRRDDDFEPGLARGARHRQAVRPEIPILGDEEEQLWPRLGRLRRTGGGRRATGDCLSESPHRTAQSFPRGRA